MIRSVLSAREAIDLDVDLWDTAPAATDEAGGTAVAPTDWMFGEGASCNLARFAAGGCGAVD
jgi:hypothetical protein